MSIEKSWTEIYNSENEKLLALCRRYVSDIQVAEDLLHDGFIKAIEKSHTYTGKGPLEGWLRQIIVNTVLDYLRNNKNTSSANIEDVNIADDTPTQIELESAKSIVSINSFSHEELLETIDLLPVHHKTVFNLYVIDGYGHKDIAELLKIEVNTSKSHLARARKKIQDLLADKVVEMNKNKEHKKKALAALPLLGTGATEAHPIDVLFKSVFENHKIASGKTTPEFKTNLKNAKPLKIKGKPSFFQSPANIYWTVGVGSALTIGSVVCYQHYNAKKIKSQPKMEQTISTEQTLQAKDSAIETTSNVIAEKEGTVKHPAENIVVKSNNSATDKSPAIESKENAGAEKQASVQANAENTKNDSADAARIAAKKAAMFKKVIKINN